MPQKKWDSTSTTSQGSTLSLKSLASKTRTSIQNFKQKATEILSPGCPKKNKKTKHVPQQEHTNEVTDTENRDSQPSVMSSREGSVIGIMDGDNAVEELVLPRLDSARLRSTRHQLRLDLKH